MGRNISLIKTSRFLKKEDVEPQVTVTIQEIVEQNVAMEGASEEVKFCAHFNELDKGLVLNWTNAQLISNAVGTSDMDAWPGNRVTLYHDPNVSFGGKLIGGIRVRSADSIPDFS